MSTHGAGASGPLTTKFQVWRTHQKLGVRNCFHPGATSLSRDYVGIASKEVSGREMISALAAYVWPKVGFVIKFAYTVVGSLGGKSCIIDVEKY